jgi:hypothetical protein
MPADVQRFFMVPSFPLVTRTPGTPDDRDHRLDAVGCDEPGGPPVPATPRRRTVDTSSSASRNEAAECGYSASISLAKGSCPRPDPWPRRAGRRRRNGGRWSPGPGTLVPSAMMTGATATPRALLPPARARSLWSQMVAAASMRSTTRGMKRRSTEQCRALSRPGVLRPSGARS